MASTATDPARRSRRRAARRAARLVRVGVLVAVAVVAGGAFGEGARCEAEAPAAEKASVASDEVRALVRDLDSPRFAVRDAAMRRLQDAGESAYDELQAARRSTSREVRWRAAAALREIHHRTVVRDFAQLGRLPDGKIDVEYGMWLVARILNPRVTRDSLQRPLDDLARRVRARLGPDVDVRKVAPRDAIETLRLVIYEEERFAGNERDYANPENSSLEFVLAKRRGLPILMSHLMIGVAERLDWPLVGVPLPGRYIVRYVGERAPAGAPKEDVYFDAFAGQVMSREDLEQRFGQLEGDELTESNTPRKILRRMLNNLANHLSLRGGADSLELVAACQAALEREEDPFEDE